MPPSTSNRAGRAKKCDLTLKQKTELLKELEFPSVNFEREALYGLHSYSSIIVDLRTWLIDWLIDWLTRFTVRIIIKWLHWNTGFPKGHRKKVRGHRLRRLQDQEAQNGNSRARASPLNGSNRQARQTGALPHRQQGRLPLCHRMSGKKHSLVQINPQTDG